MGLGHSPSVVQSGLSLYLDPGNTKSYPGSGSSVTDLSGNGNTFTFNGTPHLNYGYGGSVRYSGAQHLSSSFTPSNTWSICIWFNNTSTYNDNNRGLFSTFNVGNFNGCYVATTTSVSDSLRIWYNSNLATILSYAFSINTWYNLTVTCDGTTLLVYVNGVLVNTISTATTHADTLAIGVSRFNTNYWIGNIAQTLVYSRAITPEEVRQNYSAGRGRFDSFYPIPISSSSLVTYLDSGNLSSYPGSGSTWTDLSGSGNHATLYNSPVLTRTNGATFNLNSSNQYADIAALANYNFGSAVTLGFWHYNSTTNANKYRGVICNVYVSGTGFDFRYGSEDSGTRLYGIIRTSVTSYTSYINTPLDAWGFFCLVYDGATLKIYRNGQLASSMAATGTLGSVNASVDIGRNANSTEYLNGSLASIFIYARALSQQEITHSFNALRGRFGL
jgi:hypothetical protein